MSWPNKLLVIAGCLPLLTFASGWLIARLLQNTSPGKQKKSNNIGGKIGNAERLLIFVFILAGCYEAIGFLLAAKSILRFNESKQDKEYAEYVLYGTLLSVLCAATVSFGAIQILKS